MRYSYFTACKGKHLHNPIPKTTYGLIALGLSVPLYAALQTKRYTGADEIPREKFANKQQFRASFLAYFPSLILVTFGWGNIIQGIQRWIHMEKNSQPMVIAGVILVFFGLGYLKGLIYCRVRIKDRVLEYKKWENRFEIIELTEMKTVEFKTTYLDAYILIEKTSGDFIKIPAHLWNGPLLYAQLRTYVKNTPTSSR